MSVLAAASSAQLAAQAIGLRAMQKQDELEQLADWLSQRSRARSVCEIGTYAGGVLWLLAQCAAPDARLIAVDLNRDVYQPLEPVAGQRLDFVCSDSHDPITLAFLRQCFPDGIDVLFIDADHSYEGVRQDWEMYRPLVSQGGVIIFHDICEHPPECECEVSRLWAQIKAGHETVELIAEPETWGGIGVVLL